MEYVMYHGTLPITTVLFFFFGWDMTNFLHSSSHGFVFLIFGENRVDNSHVLVTAEQFIHSMFFMLPCKKEAGGARETGRGQIQDC